MAAAVDDGDGGGAAQVLSDEAALQAADGQHLGARIGAVDRAGCGAHQDGQGQGLRWLVDGQRAQASLRMPSALVDVDAEIAQLLDSGNLAEDDAGDGDRRQGVEGRGLGGTSNELLEALERAGARGGDGACGGAGEAACLGEGLAQGVSSGGSLRGGGDETLPIGALSGEKYGRAGHGMQHSNRHLSSFELMGNGFMKSCGQD